MTAEEEIRACCGSLSYGALQPHLLDTLMYCTSVLGPRLMELCEAVDDLAIASRDM